ncbi:MAG TPA: class I SAM-dependent methyltransferase [Spirochaetia bacterium]|nr:class I SAM-dependent methyltransferase [Spirochaetia bacterium]
MRQIEVEDSARVPVRSRLLTSVADHHWRHVLARLVDAQPGELVCDMATGKGDAAIAIARRYSAIRVLAVDSSRNMLRGVRKKITAFHGCSNMRLMESDVYATAIATATVDVLTVCFALSEIADRRGLLKEAHRVLRPQGRLYVMEHSLPGARPIRFGDIANAGHDIPVLGHLLPRHDGDGECVPLAARGASLAGIMEDIRETGFKRVRVIPLGYGIAIVCAAIRSEDEG